MPPVPTITSVVRGASVNIILKADQPTGRTVSGQVQDILTRGNHPRGIKVRLADGRVGRVQSMATAAAASSTSASAGGVGPVESRGLAGDKPFWDALPREPGWDDGGRSAEGGRGRGGRGRGRGRGRGGRDGGSRQQQEEELPSQTVGLDAYIRPAKVKGQKGRRYDPLAMSGVDDGQSGPGSSGGDGGGGVVDGPGEAVTCPVCQDFEGDAAAVEHHVASHFD